MTNKDINIVYITYNNIISSYPNIRTNKLFCKNCPPNTIEYDKAYIYANEFKNAIDLLHNRIFDNLKHVIYVCSNESAIMAQMIGTFHPKCKMVSNALYDTGLTCLNDISCIFQDYNKPLCKLPEIITYMSNM